MVSSKLASVGARSSAAGGAACGPAGRRRRPFGSRVDTFGAAVVVGKSECGVDGGGELGVVAYRCGQPMTELAGEAGDFGHLRPFAGARHLCQRGGSGRWRRWTPGVGRARRVFERFYRVASADKPVEVPAWDWRSPLAPRRPTAVGWSLTPGPAGAAPFVCCRRDGSLPYSWGRAPVETEAVPPVKLSTERLDEIPRPPRAFRRRTAYCCPPRTSGADSVRRRLAGAVRC